MLAPVLCAVGQEPFFTPIFNAPGKGVDLGKTWSRATTPAAPLSRQGC